MFINYIRDFFLKSIYKKKIQNVINVSSSKTIQTVGVLIDESYFFEKEAFVKELINNGILENNIRIISYRDKIKKNELYTNPTFNLKDFNWKSQIKNSDVNHFINEKFDLLISYYDVEKVVLLNITNESKADFKAGFSTIDKKLNHFMINTNAENHTVFTQELFKYLKILNKI
jgi:hypothetical protein